MRRGMVRAIPLLPGVFIYGMAFGILASEASIGAVQAVLMSAVVFSGTAQLATLALLGANAGLLAITATIFVVNARYILYGAALRPWLGGLSAGKAYSSLYFMGDANWVVSMHARDGGESDAAFVFGSGVIMFAPWVAGTIVGYGMGALIANPAALGVDFFLVSFCVAMGVGMARKKGDLWTIGAAGSAALLANAFLPAGWTPAVAGVAGGLIAFARYDAGR